MQRTGNHTSNSESAKNERQKLQESLLKSIPKSSPAIRKAVIDIVARKYTWRLASIVNGVTESGILWPCSAQG